MKLPRYKFHIGLRTFKTVLAVALSMLVADLWGATDSSIILAMLGAMAAVQPSFIESFRSCLAQTVGVLLGAAASLLLIQLPVPPLVSSVIGILITIILYNGLHISHSPVLACMIVVIMCYDSEAQPVLYALARIWDSAIGLSIGMVINTLVFPYDNSRQIRQTIHSLDKTLIRFLEELFDGDDVLPNPQQMQQTISRIHSQMAIFSNQRLLLHLKRQRSQLEAFRFCEAQAQELLARMVILSRVPRPGRLNEENRRKLQCCGADIRDTRPLDAVQELDVVTNYHVAQILKLRRQLLDTLEKTS